VTIRAANVMPVVALTTPVAGATFAWPAAVSVMAAASDADGSIARVDFYGDGVLIGSAVASPYSITWSAVAAGTHTVWAEARDDRGGVKASAPVSFALIAPPPPAAVAFTPSDDPTLVRTYRLEIYGAGAVPGTTAAVAVRDLGMPAVVGGESTVDISSMLAALPAGTYTAAVVAVGSGGEARSASSEPFVR
jgi:hypothetical protein